METKTETTIVLWGNIGIMEKKIERLSAAIEVLMFQSLPSQGPTMRQCIVDFFGA